MAEGIIYTKGIVPRNEDFREAQKLRGEVYNFLKDTMEETTESAFQALGYKQKAKPAGFYGDGKAYGYGIDEGVYNVKVGSKTDSYLEKRVSLGGKRVVIEMHMTIYPQSMTVEMHYKNTEDAAFRGFHEGKKGGYMINEKIIMSCADMEKFKKEMTKKLKEFSEKEIGYITMTKLGNDDRMEKSTASVVETFSLKSLFKDDFETSAKKIMEATQYVAENGDEDEEEEDLLLGDELSEDDETTDEVTTSGAGAGSAGNFGYDAPLGAVRKRSIKSSAPFTELVDEAKKAKSRLTKQYNTSKSTAAKPKTKKNSVAGKNFSWTQKIKEEFGFNETEETTFSFTEPVNEGEFSVKKYKAKIKHDGGTLSMTTTASSKEAAIEKICKAEGCPKSAIKSIEEVPMKEGRSQVGLFENFKKGQKLKVDFGDGPEEVEVMDDFKVGASNVNFISLKRKSGGAPYTVTFNKLKKSLVNKLNESTLTQKGRETIENWIKSMTPRDVAQKLIDVCLAKKTGGLTSSDLPDTSTFANGLDTVQEYIETGDLQAAWNEAKNTALDMLEDEGYGDMFETQINELSPGAYDKIAAAGEKRNDGRGRNIAYTAKTLKARDFVGQKFSFWHRETGTVEDTIEHVVTYPDYQEIYIHGSKRSHIYVLADGNVKGTYDEITSAPVEVTRETARLFQKMLKHYFDVDVHPNTFKQVSESQINELSPGAYDKIAQSARGRNDVRGQNMAKTAQSLKARPFVGKEVEFETSEGIQKHKISDVKTRGNIAINVLVLELDGRLLSLDIVNDGRVNFQSTSVGEPVQVSRATARLFSQMFLHYFREEVRPNTFKQISESQITQHTMNETSRVSSEDGNFDGQEIQIYTINDAQGEMFSNWESAMRWLMDELRNDEELYDYLASNLSTMDDLIVGNMTFAGSDVMDHLRMIKQHQINETQNKFEQTPYARRLRENRRTTNLRIIPEGKDGFWTVVDQSTLDNYKKNHIIGAPGAEGVEVNSDDEENYNVGGHKKFPGGKSHKHNLKEAIRDISHDEHQSRLKHATKVYLMHHEGEVVYQKLPHSKTLVVYENANPESEVVQGNPAYHVARPEEVIKMLESGYHAILNAYHKIHQENIDPAIKKRWKRVEVGTQQELHERWKRLATHKDAETIREAESVIPDREERKSPKRKLTESVEGLQKLTRDMGLEEGDIVEGKTIIEIPKPNCLAPVFYKVFKEDYENENRAFLWDFNTGALVNNPGFKVK